MTSRLFCATNRIIFIFLLIFCTASLNAAAITGRVVDRISGQPLAGATVTIGSETLETSADGSFTLQDARAGEVITITYVGYLDRMISIPASSTMLVSLEQTEQLLDDMLVTAQRSDRSVARTPRTAYRANAGDIERSGAHTTVDALRTLPGVTMTDAGSFRTRPVIRGLYGSRLLVLIDGERQNDQRDISDFAGVSLSLLDVNEIDRIEVVSGSTSPLYGSDAMGGVINVITQKPGFSASLRPTGRYSGRYSTTDEQQSHRLEFGVENADWYVYAASMWRQTERNFRPPSDWQKESGYVVFDQAFYDALKTRTGRSFGDAGLVNTGAEVQNLDMRLGLRLNNQSRLESNFGLFQADNIGYPGVPNAATPFYFYYPQHDRKNGSLSYVLDQVSGVFGRFESKLYVQQVEKLFLTDFLGSLRIGTGPGGPTIVPQTAASKTEVTKIGLNIQQQLSLSETQNGLFGIEGWTEKHRGSVNEISLLDFSFPGPPDMMTSEIRASVPESRWNAVGLFGRYAFPIGPVDIETGARLDLFDVTSVPTSGYIDENDNPLPADDDNFTALSGSFGAMVPVSGGVSVYTSLGSAYRVPNTVERFYYGQQEGRNIRPNPDVQPERSYSLETGFKGVQPTFSYSLNGFINEYEQFSQLRKVDPAAVTNVLWSYQNAERATIYGGELLVEGRMANGLYGNFAVSYQHGDSKVDSIWSPLFVAPLTTNVSMGWRDRDQVTFVEASFRKVENQARASSSSALDDVPTRGFRTVNLAAGLRLFEQLRATVTVNNLFDELYSEPFNARVPDNPIPEPGRNVIFSLSTNLF